MMVEQDTVITIMLAPNPLQVAAYGSSQHPGCIPSTMTGKAPRSEGASAVSLSLPDSAPRRRDAAVGANTPQQAGRPVLVLPVAVPAKGDVRRLADSRDAGY